MNSLLRNLFACGSFVSAVAVAMPLSGSEALASGGAGMPLAIHDTPTPHVQQQCPTLCWAATIEMVTRRLGIGKHQCQVASARAGTNCCFPGSCNVIPLCGAGSGGEPILTAGLQWAGVRGSVHRGGPLPEPVLQAELRAGRPVIAANMPHAFVIAGYSDDGPVPVYKVLDPLAWQPLFLTYSQITFYNGHPWVYTWYELRP